MMGGCSLGAPTINVCGYELSVVMFIDLRPTVSPAAYIVLRSYACTVDTVTRCNHSIADNL